MAQASTDEATDFCNETLYWHGTWHSNDSNNDNIFEMGKKRKNSNPHSLIENYTLFNRPNLKL